MEHSSSLNKKNKKNQFSCNFLSGFSALCSFLLSHPLYLSYLFFFSPYLIKLLAFLSPLFFTTTLLLLCLLTSFLHESLSFSSIVENFSRIGGEEDERKELEGFEEFEVYIIVFGSSMEIDGTPEISLCGEGDEKEEKVLGVLISEEIESPVENSGEIEGKFCGIPITDQVGGTLIEEEFEEEKILGVLISDEKCFPARNEHSVQETPKCEKLINGTTVKAGEKSQQMVDKNVKPLELTPRSINGGNQTQQKEIIKSHSTRHGEAVWDTNHIYTTSKKLDDEDDKFSYSSSPQSEPISPCLSNFGSMRKEKEWRRTLACKLFEERHNGGGGGGEQMDSLWEAYEKTEENRGKQRTGLKKKKSGLSYDEQDEVEEEEDEDERDNGKLCCLQALKFSAVKMNFGMGKPGFLKVTKAFKGFGGGWLTHHSRHQSSGGRKKGKNH